MKVLSNSIKEELPAVFLIVNDALALDSGSNVVYNAFKFFVVEKIINFTRGK